MDDAAFQHEETPQEDSAPLFVSLYIVLLAFFIMLNTMATIDEKRLESAMQSINKAFSMTTPIAGAPALMDDAGTELHATQFFNELKSVASSFVPAEYLDVYTTGNVMEMVIPEEYVFIPLTHEFHQQAKPFFQNLVPVLMKWYPALRIEAEMLVSIEPAEVSLNPDRRSEQLGIKRATALSTFLTGKGMNEKNVVPGLRSDAKGNITMIFTVRDIKDAKLNLKAPEDAPPEPREPKEAPANGQ